MMAQAITPQPAPATWRTIRRRRLMSVVMVRLGAGLGAGLGADRRRNRGDRVVIFARSVHSGRVANSTVSRTESSSVDGVPSRPCRSWSPWIPRLVAGVALFAVVVGTAYFWLGHRPVRRESPALEACLLGAAVVLLVGVAVWCGAAGERRRHRRASRMVRVDDGEPAIDSRPEMAGGAQRLRLEVAGELHDHISQNLAAAMIRLELLKKQELADRSQESLAVAIDLLRDCVKSCSVLMRRLAQPSIEHLGIGHTLAELVAENRANSGVEFEFRETGSGPLVGDWVVETVVETVHRGVRELLKALVASGSATRIAVELTHGAGSLEVRVLAEGAGGAGVANRQSGPPNLLVGLGLQELRARIRGVGGTVSAESAVGSGVIVAIFVPAEVADPASPE